MMQLNLTKEIRNATVVCGFQGSWLVGPITMQYLKDHLEFENVGSVWFDSMFPLAMVYGGEVVKPLTVYHNTKHNILLLQSLMPSVGVEWQLSEAVFRLSEKVEAKEVICIEGVDTGQDEEGVFYITNCDNEERIAKAGATKLKNAVLFGITSALLIRDFCPAFFVYGKMNRVVEEGGPAMMSFSDSVASASVIKFLNQYLDINVDVTDLLEKSSQIERQIKDLASKSKQETKPSYFG